MAFWWAEHKRIGNIQITFPKGLKNQGKKCLAKGLRDWAKSLKNDLWRCDEPRVPPASSVSYFRKSRRGGLRQEGQLCSLHKVAGDTLKPWSPTRSIPSGLFVANINSSIHLTVGPFVYLSTCHLSVYSPISICLYSVSHPSIHPSSILPAICLASHKPFFRWTPTWYGSAQYVTDSAMSVNRSMW